MNESITSKRNCKRDYSEDRLCIVYKDDYYFRGRTTSIKELLSHSLGLLHWSLAAPDAPAPLKKTYRKMLAVETQRLEGQCRMQYGQSINSMIIIFQNNFA